MPPTERTLSLLRHGKSSWDDESLADFDRPLAKRGLRDLGLLATRLHDDGFAPDMILCSSARRAREPLAVLLPHLATETEIVLTRKIYDADAGALLALVRAQKNTPHLMLIGHNPAFENLARMLANGGDADALARMRTKFPTAALATICFTLADWTAIAPGTGQLTAFSTPNHAD